MKSIYLFLLGLYSLSLCSCSPNKFYLVNSEGIFTYNRHTGQIELMWETKTQKVESDTLNTVK